MIKTRPLFKFSVGVLHRLLVQSLTQFVLYPAYITTKATESTKEEINRLNFVHPRVLRALRSEWKTP